MNCTTSGSKPKLFRTILIAGLALLAVSARAAIPAAALADPRYGLGYLVVTYYTGVTNDGSGDCTAGIQAAINDAYTAIGNFHGQMYADGRTNAAITTRPLAVFFPPGTYQISSNLVCYEWDCPTAYADSSFHVLIGSTAGGGRPRIKLAQNLSLFGNAAAPQPMIAYRCLTTPNCNPVPVPNPMLTPSGATNDDASNFYAELRNLDFDCNGNPGAFGVMFPGAQWCTLENVKVWATNALAGFYTLPGRGACAANLEVAGGQYGIIHGSYPALGLTLYDGSAQATIVGLTLENQTSAAVLIHDWCGASSIVGFNITGRNLVATNGWATSDGPLTLLDGQITLTGGNNLPAIVNGGKRDFYVRNVYVSGTTNLVQSSTTTTGSGTWSRIAEYAFTDPTVVAGVPPNSNYYWTTTNKTEVFESYGLINGTTQNWTVPFPAPPNIVTNCGTPPTNLVSEHLWATFPSYNGGDPTNDPPTVVVSTNSGCWHNTNDSTAVLQAAIDLASTNTSPNYNGRVYVPGGQYYLTNTILLRSNTMLIGLGRLMTCLKPSWAGWMPTQPVNLVQTENNAHAVTTLAYLSLIPRNVVWSSDTNYTWLTLLSWQAGGNSVVLGVDAQAPYAGYTYTQPRSQVQFTNNGGGQYYMMDLGSGGTANENNPLFRRLRVMGTTQPLWVYGCNLEHIPWTTEAEINGASNVRLLTMKTETGVPLVTMTNCTNVAAFGLGAAEANVGNNGYISVQGASTNILCANLCVNFDDDQPGTTGNILYEAITGKPATNVLWPNCVSLYKRGELNDAAMFPGTTSPLPTPTGLTAARDTTFPSTQIDVSWNSVEAQGYYLQRSTTNGGPYSVLDVLSAGVTNYNDNTVLPGTAYYYVVAAFSCTQTCVQSTNSAQAVATTRTNVAPTLNAIANLTANMNAPLQTVTLSGLSAGANESSQSLTVTASSSNPNLLAPSVTYTSPNPTGTLTFTPAANASGTANITVTVQDNGGTAGGGVNTVTQAFTVTITSHLGFAGPAMSGGKLVLAGNGGLAGGTYEVLTSTNLALPLANWTPVLTNLFGGDGSFSNALAMISSDPHRFYRLQANPVSAAPFDYALVQTPTAPVIDGAVDAIWSTANSAAITNVSSGVISNSADCSASFRALWDATNVYVLVQVTDDVSVHINPLATGYQDDAVEIYFDANNTKATNYQANDFHYQVYLLGGTNLVVVEANNKTNGVAAAWLYTGVAADYVVELKFPWSLLGQTNVAAGALLGFDAQIDDKDTTGSLARDGELQWHDSTDTDWQHPNLFGTARLVLSP